MLLWTFVYKYLNICFQFVLGICIKHLCTSICVPVFEYLFSVCFGSRIVESCHNSVLTFKKNIFEEPHDCFPYLLLHRFTSPLAVYLPISPPPCQCLLFSDFGGVGILVGVSAIVLWFLTAISLMANEFDHLFLCVLAICISSLERCLFKVFAHFWIRFCCCWVVGVLYIFCILDPYQIYDLQIFFPLCGLSFHLKKNILFIYFLERGQEGEREGEIHQCVRDTAIGCLSRPQLGTWPHNPGTCPDWE